MNLEYFLGISVPATKRQPLVLVVDSNIDNVEVATQVVSICGCLAIAATDGYTALQMVEKYQPDLIMLELMLPGKDGVELIKHFRLNANTVPIIVVTGLDTEQHQQRAIFAGCNEFIKKPYQIHELQAAIARHVDLPTPLIGEGNSLN